MADAPPMGHNGGPFDFFEFFDIIVDSSANTYEKLLALILARHVGKNGEAAYPSRARMMKQASCSVATFKRSQAALDAFFAAETRKGKATLYAPRPLVTAGDVEAAILAARAESKVPEEPGSDSTRYPTDTEVGISQIPTQEAVGISEIPRGALTDTTRGISQIPQKDPLNEPLKEDTDPRGSGSELPEASLREIVWTKCITWLLPRSCLDEVRLRNRVGRWVQEFGAGAVLNAVAVAQKEAPVSIMAYVEGVLRRQSRGKSVSSEIDERDRRHREFRDLLRVE